MRAGAAEVPVLTKGTVVLVLPSEDTYGARIRGEYLPFWVCKVMEDERAELGMSAALPTSLRLFIPQHTAHTLR